MQLAALFIFVAANAVISAAISADIDVSHFHFQRRDKRLYKVILADGTYVFAKARTFEKSIHKEGSDKIPDQDPGSPCRTVPESECFVCPQIYRQQSHSKPLRSIILSLFVLFLAISTNAVWAGDFEITPFIGGMFNSTFDVTNAENPQLQLDGGLDWGFNVGGLVGENIGIEFMFNRVTSQMSVKDTGEELFNLNTNQYDVNFLYHFGTRESKARPYFLAGMGATKFQPHSDEFDISSVTKFNLGFGGGVKAYFTDHFGIRGELRYTPTYLSTTTDGIFCISGNGCFVDEAQNWLNQLDFTVGTIFRF